jgi:hypothetical protein
LDENQLKLVSVNKAKIELIGSQYTALSISARKEINSMEKVYNSRVLSRIGFITQEIKDLELDLSQDIQRYVVGVDNNACLMEARRNLESSSAAASETIKGAASIVIIDLQAIRQSFVYPVLHDIELLRSVFEVHSFNVFGYTNSATNMLQISTELESDVKAYSDLFEVYVNKLYTDLFIHNILTDELSEEAFSLLDGGLENFQKSINLIRSSLSSCN